MTIAANSYLIFHHRSLDFAITQLSALGYRIVKFSAVNHDSPAMIELDRPLEGIEAVKIEGKDIHFAPYLDCRVWWRACELTGEEN